MSRPCVCDAARPGEYTRDQCWDCWRWHNSPWWQARWEAGVAPAPPPKPPPRPLRPPCRREGAVLEFSRCRGEAGHVRDCDRHDRCVRGPHPRAAVRVCLDCPDYEPPTSAGRV